MSYSAITTLLHDPEASQEAFEYAIEAARHWNAHLHVVCAGIDLTDPGYYYVGAQAIAVQSNLEHARGAASEIEAFARKRLELEDINWDVETVTMLANGIEPFLAEHMRFYDLAILPLPYDDGRKVIDISNFEACVFGACIPVIAVPNGAKWKTPDSNILIAWDDGAEALAATRAALPLITSAAQSDIYVIDPPRFGPERSDPGGRLAQLLARAGANVEITVAAQQQNSIAAQLMQRAEETGVDMLVMGAYGHSRIREAVIGGVTRSILHESNTPVLMAH